MSDFDDVTYWNDEAGPRWVRVQPMIDGMLHGMTDRLMSRAAIGAGQTVVDIGCGCGTTTLAAARATGDAGAVFGVDLSEPMLIHARARAADEGIGWARFEQQDATTYDFASAQADAAISRFGVMFFRDNVAAFANIRRALKPGGSFCFICWHAPERNPWATWVMRDLADVLPPPEPPPEGDAPGPFRFADASFTTGTLRAAGFERVDCEVLDLPARIEAPVDKILDFFQEVGPLSGVMEGLEPQRRQDVLGVLTESLASRHDGEALEMPACAWLVTAS